MMFPNAGPVASAIPLTNSDSAKQFESRIRPLLVQYCADCHAPGEMQDLDFLAAKTATNVLVSGIRRGGLAAGI